MTVAADPFEVELAEAARLEVELAGFVGRLDPDALSPLVAAGLAPSLQEAVGRSPVRGRPPARGQVRATPGRGNRW